MRKGLVAVVALSLFGGAACNRARADFEDICNAAERSGAAEVPDPARRAQHVAQWIEGRLRSRDAEQFFKSIVMVSAEEKGKMLLEAAREAGYTGPCPMAAPVR